MRRRRSMIILRLICALVAAGAAMTMAAAQSSRSPWPPGDEIGMANTLGPATWQRCATYLADPKAKSYEISYLRSNTMPQSPFGVPLRDRYRPTVGIAGTRHAFNGEETVSGEPGAQGTQMDAIGHFAVLPQAWDGKGEFPAESAQYYGGYKQADVKPAPGHLEKFFSPSRYESDSLTAMGHGRMERASHGADGIFRC